MKKSNVLFLIAVIICCFSACKTKNTGASNDASVSDTSNGNSSNNDELKAFMLAGIYTINGYGGIPAVEDNVKQNAGDDKDKMIKGYEQMLEFPFEVGQEGVKESLSEMWDINNKEDLLKRLAKLQNDSTSKHKAWDYARLVNNVHMGFAAGYITKEEGKKWIVETLPLAQKSFKSWSEYHKDFIEGRKVWNPDSDDAAEFEALANTISESSIYKIVPLN